MPSSGLAQTQNVFNKKLSVGYVYEEESFDI